MISGEESMLMTHWMRSMHDAILVGINTIICDDPRLKTLTYRRSHSASSTTTDLGSQPPVSSVGQDPQRMEYAQGLELCRYWKWGRSTTMADLRHPRPVL